MKRTGLFIIMAILVLGGCVVLYSFLFGIGEKMVDPISEMPSKENQNTSPVLIQFEHLGKSEYMDNPDYYDMFMVEPGAPYTWPDIIDRCKRLSEIEHQYQFVGPENFDFENYALFIVFGREIVNLGIVRK